MKPKLLDLFCGAGGCTKGYQDAGFYVVGVDINQQPRYVGDEFIQADVMAWLPVAIKHGYTDQFAVIHASPPCQKYGRTKHLAGSHAKLIDPVRALLVSSGKPYVIENVPGASLINPFMLTGAMFGMRIKRDRLFECSRPLPLLLSPTTPKPVKMGRPVRDGDILQPVGNFSGADYARQEMGIDWMPKKSLSQAIPPAYTRYIGERLLAQGVAT